MTIARRAPIGKRRKIFSYKSISSHSSGAKAEEMQEFPITFARFYSILMAKGLNPSCNIPIGTQLHILLLLQPIASY
jgi:hypothetical protein